MNPKFAVGLCALGAIIALVISTAALREAHAARANGSTTIAAIATLTKQLEATRATLESAQYREGDNGALESYLIRLRRDGAVRSAAMKQQLDSQAAQIATLNTLVDLHAAAARTDAFRQNVPAFRAYAVSWQDRWNALLETFMAGGNYPVSEFAYPDGWAAAVATELAATR